MFWVKYKFSQWPTHSSQHAQNSHKFHAKSHQNWMLSPLALYLCGDYQLSLFPSLPPPLLTHLTLLPFHHWLSLSLSLSLTVSQQLAVDCISNGTSLSLLSQKFDLQLQLHSLGYCNRFVEVIWFILYLCSNCPVRCLILCLMLCKYRNCLIN